MGTRKAQDSSQDYLNGPASRLKPPPRQTTSGTSTDTVSALSRRGAGACAGIRSSWKGHPPAPSLGVLHVPHADIITRTGRDLTAERIARYLADLPPERALWKADR